MSIILGLNANHADSSACIIINGRLCSAFEEERFNRIKHWSGLPIESIKNCLSQNNLSFDQITDVAINTNPRSNINEKFFYFLKNYFFGKKKYEILKRLKNKVTLKNKLELVFDKNNNINYHFIDHHAAHIASAYYPSTFKKCLGVSIDGFGDFCSMVIADCDDGKITPFKKIFFPNSLGVFYEAMTQFLGFRNYGDEYKMMGLASYGEPKFYDLIQKNIFNQNSKNDFELNLNFFNFHKNNFQYKFDGSPKQDLLFSKKIHELLPVIKDEQNIENTKLKSDIASSAQKVFENYLFKIFVKYKKDYDNLVYTGGCALNSLANGKVLEKKIFKEIYIPYAPGDNGGAIGAALICHKKNYSQFDTKNLQSPYLGDRYNDEQINDILIKKYSKKITFSLEKNFQILATKTAKLLCDDNVIGWFQGNMEFGPRALGNRSILASPINKNMKSIINKKIKKRESFRPFAPVIIEDKKNEWFENESVSKFMSFVETIKQNQRQKIPAVTHKDGSGRVQTVNKDDNENLYILLNEFYKITNVPVLLNTSFNENEPIVRTPEHAIECFLRNDMDFLIINNFILEKI